MKKPPPHPGTVLRQTLAPLQLPVTELAECLAMSRVAMSRVLNGRAGISPDLAVRLERAGVGTAREWIALQAEYDLAAAMARKQPPVRLLHEAFNQVTP